MDPFAFFRDEDAPPAGPLIVGVPWPAPPVLVRTAAGLAAGLEVHLVCAFVDPASYLTEWEPLRTLSAASLDPAPNDEALYPSEDIRASLEGILGAGSTGWSFRVLNGDVASALARLGRSIGASMFVVGSGRDGLAQRVSRMLEGSVSARLIRIQNRPVVVVPDHGLRHRKALGSKRTGA